MAAKDENPAPQKVDRRKENASQTQAALREAGVRLFGSLGYEATAIGALCAEARVTTGALYHHYGDKKGLFAAIVEEIDGNLVKAAEAASREVIARGGDPWQAFLATIDVVLHAGMNAAGRRIMLTDAPAVLGAVAWEAIRQRHGLGAMAQSVRFLQANAIFGDEDPVRLARIILGMLYGAVESLPAEPAQAASDLDEARRWVHVMLLALRNDIAARPVGR